MTLRPEAAAGGIAPDAAWKDLSDDWVCPVLQCGQKRVLSGVKSQFGASMIRSSNAGHLSASDPLAGKASARDLGRSYLPSRMARLRLTAHRSPHMVQTSWSMGLEEAR
ncbi:MAG: hypothetical protein FWD79_05085 [Desulfobulbus sp.]|nr:hypothetical protein [Desulfobulbus sp.]